VDAQQVARYAEADAILRRYGDADNPYRRALQLEAAIGNTPPDPEALRILASDSYRGVSTPELLVEREYREREHARARELYEGGDLSAFEWVQFCGFWLEDLRRELERRERYERFVRHTPRARIDRALIERIKERLPLPDFIGRTVPLRKSGYERWAGHCPFHADRTASFMVWEDHYYAFCCQVTGDHFSWVQRDGCTFVEAVNRVAAEAGIDLAPPPTPRQVIPRW